MRYAAIGTPGQMPPTRAS